MNDQAPPQPQQQQPVQVNLNGGVYPNEDGTWRVVCWFTGFKSETEAAHVSGWLNGLLQANISKNEQAPQPPHPGPNGAAQPS